MNNAEILKKLKKLKSMTESHVHIHSKMTKSIEAQFHKFAKIMKIIKQKITPSAISHFNKKMLMNEEIKITRNVCISCDENGCLNCAEYGFPCDNCCENENIYIPDCGGERAFMPFHKYLANSS